MDRASPILLIDDDRLWLESLSDYLSGKGFDVRTAEGGPRGLKLLESLDVPLAVVDFNMPEMNGLELLRHVRRRKPGVAVLLLSNEEDPGLPARALAEGARAFLPKSAPPRQILEALRQALAVYGGGVAGAACRPERLLPVLLPFRTTLPVPVGFYRSFPRPRS